LRCEYKPVKAKKRRRTVSNPENIGIRPPTTAPGQHYESHDRLHAVPQDSISGSSILSNFPTTPQPTIAEGWKVHSADPVLGNFNYSCKSDGFDEEYCRIPFAEDPPTYDPDIMTTREIFTAPSSASSESSSYPDPTSAFLSPQSGGSPYYPASDIMNRRTIKPSPG
jgi:hypothetical protein